MLVNLVLSCLFLLLSRNLLRLGIPLFEEIILTAVVGSIFTFFVFAYLKNRNIFNEPVRMISYLTVIGLFLSVLVFPYSLVNIDRSRSFYVLSWVNLNKVQIESGELILSVNSSESVDKRGVLLRLNEQEQRGLVSEMEGAYQVTRYGKFLLRIANLLAHLFHLENWNANKT